MRSLVSLVLLCLLATSTPAAESIALDLSNAEPGVTYYFELTVHADGSTTIRRMKAVDILGNTDDPDKPDDPDDLTKEIIGWTRAVEDPDLKKNARSPETRTRCAAAARDPREARRRGRSRGSGRRSDG